MRDLIYCYYYLVNKLALPFFTHHHIMANAFDRKPSSSGTVLDRIMKEKTANLAQNHNQQNMPIKQNTSKPEELVSGSKINKTESLDLFFKNQNQVYSHKKNDIQIGDDKEKNQKQLRASPEKKAVNVFDPNYKQDLKKQDKIPKGRLLTLKILNKQNKCLGQLQLDQNYLKSKGKEPPTQKQAKVQISKEFKNECSHEWSKIKHYKQTLNLALNSTNLSILSSISRSPHQPMPENIIQRLTDGFYFYQFSQQRDDAIRQLMRQYTEAGINSGLCEQVRRVSQKNYQGSKVDGGLAFYYCLNGGRDDDCSKFLMEDMINLIRIYQNLMKQGRLSSRKLIKTSHQTTILQTLPKYYSKYMNNSLGSELGRQILGLLDVVVIKQKRQINKEELINVFVPLIRQLQNIMSVNKELKASMDSFMMELFGSWETELEGVQIGGVVEQFVIAYYRRYHGKDISKLHGFMVKLAQFTLYGASMQTLVLSKCQQFIGENRTSTDRSKQMLMHTAMESIFLLNECKKLNIAQPELLQILYHCCPVAILTHLHNTTHHIQIILPLICKYYKNSPNKANQLTIAQLNNSLPPSYALPKSQNYLIIKYLVDLLMNYSGTEIVNSCYQKLDDIQETLLKFNASSIVRQTSDYAPLQIIKLICKYVVSFGSQYDGDGGYQIVGLLFSAMQALIRHFFNEGKGTDYSSLAGVICNVQMVSCVIINSEILTTNRQKDSVQRRRKESQNNTQIWETYTKISQLITKICQQFPCSKSHMKVVYKACIKIYEQYWSGIKQLNRWLKYKIYLQSALTIIQMPGSLKQKYDMVLLLDRRYKTYNIVHVIQQIILNCDVNETQCEADWYDIVKIGLTVLGYLTEESQARGELGQQVSTWQDGVHKIMMDNAQHLIQICLSRLFEDKSAANSTIKYCLIIHRILQQRNTESPLLNRNSNNISLVSLITKPIRTPFPKEPPSISQFISAIYQAGSSSKLHILFSLIAISFDDELFSTIMGLGYLPTILNATVTLIGTLIQSSNQDRWLITCLDMFSSLYFHRCVEVDAGNGASVAQALLRILTTVQQYVSPFKITQYMQIILPLIANTAQNKSYQTLLRASITYFAKKHTNQQHESQNNKELVIKHFVVMIQILMVSLSNDFIAATIFEGMGQDQTKSILDEMTYMLSILYDGLHQIGWTGDKSLQKWLRTLVVITLKVSQYISIFHTISSKNISTTANLLTTSISKSYKTVLSWAGQTLAPTLQQMLASSTELLESRSQTRSYNHYNEALVNLSMMTRASFTNYLVGLGAHVISTLQKMRRSSIQPTIDNYRCYYLLYYFLVRVAQDETGKYINYLYDTNPQDYLTTEVTLQQTIKQTFINIINQLSQCTNVITFEIWHITLISTILKLQPRLIKTGTVFSKLVRFCCKLMEIVQSMGQQVNYLEGWLCFAQVVDFICFIYETHSYCGQTVDEDISFLRKTIFHRVQLWMLKWDDIRAVDEEKFMYFALWPILNTEVMKDKTKKPIEILNKSTLNNYKLLTIPKNPKEQTTSEDTRSDLKQNKCKVWYYLKHIMVFHSLCKILELYRVDIEAPVAFGPPFKSNLIDFTQKLLNNFSKYYDEYFGPSQIAAENLQILKKGIQHYAKNPEITNTSCYLNKILFSFLNRPECSRKVNKNEGNSSPGSSLVKDLSAIGWFNSIEEILASMGQKTSYKFLTGKTNNLLGSRRVGASSMRVSTSRRMMF